jgi:FKBP-type peptidyl-prolyl cis-trans isomerase FkpA
MHPVVVLLSGLLLVGACSNTEQPQRPIQAVTSNPADLDIAGVEAVEIAPGLVSRTLVSNSEGKVAKAGDTAVVHYTGWLHDPQAEKSRGAKFDSSVDRGAEFRFPLGAGRVIRGWDEGVVGMHVGEVRELTIAPEMGYGDRGAGGVIPPGATLVFVVELVDLEGLETDSQ